MIKNEIVCAYLRCFYDNSKIDNMCADCYMKSFQSIYNMYIWYNSHVHHTTWKILFSITCKNYTYPCSRLMKWHKKRRNRYVVDVDRIRSEIDHITLVLTKGGLPRVLRRYILQHFILFYFVPDTFVNVSV